MKDRRTKTPLKVVNRNDRVQIKRVLAGSGQALLPMLDLLEGAQPSIDELMHDAAVTVVEQLLVLSAQELAGAKQRGRDSGPVLWHGAQRGIVALAERQLRVQRPRLRDMSGQVQVPAYDRLRDDANIGTRVRDTLVAGAGDYIDGIVVSGHHIIAAVGVDEAGDRDMLGLAMGASENAHVVKDLLRG